TQCRAVARATHLASADRHRLELRRAVESVTGKIEARAEEGERRLIQHVGHAVRLAEILLDEQPQIGQGIGRMVHVMDRLSAAELVLCRVQFGGDSIVDALLPILWSRSSRSA